MSFDIFFLFFLVFCFFDAEGRFNLSYIEYNTISDVESNENDSLLKYVTEQGKQKWNENLIGVYYFLMIFVGIRTKKVPKNTLIAQLSLTLCKNQQNQISYFKKRLLNKQTYSQKH